MVFFSRFLIIFVLNISVYFCVSDAWAINLDDYKVALAINEKVKISGMPQGDGADLTGRIYRPEGDGPFPALVALHGAGGIFPYQLWWASQISRLGVVVLFIDSYCTNCAILPPLNIKCCTTTISSSCRSNSSF